MELLNNREIAILFWVGVFLAFLLSKEKLRKSALSVLKCLFHRVILQTFFFFYAYVGVTLWCLNGLGLWDPSQTKNTVIWTIFVGIVALFDVATTSQKASFFKEWLLNNLRVIVLIEFIVSFYTFNIVVELILQPIITFIVMMNVFSEGKKEHKIVHKLSDSILVIFGIFIIGHAIQSIWSDYNGFANSQTFWDLLTPIILSIFLTPFLYALYIYSTYERIFSALRLASDDKELRRYMKFKALISFRTDTDFLERWRRHILIEKPKTKEGVTESIEHLKELKLIEKNPPDISLDEGWSPYSAQKFLVDCGITTGDYHYLYDEWFASSPPLKVGNQTILSDTISYYIEGNKRAAKSLKIHLNVNYPDESENSEKKFIEVADILFEKAFNAKPPEKYREMVVSGEGELSVNNYSRIIASRGEWDVEQHKGYDKKIILENTLDEE